MFIIQLQMDFYTNIGETKRKVYNGYTLYDPTVDGEQTVTEICWGEKFCDRLLMLANIIF